MALIRVFLGLIVLIVALVAGAWFNLDWIVTKQRISDLQALYLPELSVDWSNIDLEIRNQGIFRKRIKIEKKEGDFCASYLSSSVCFRNLEVDGVINPFDWASSDLEALRIVTDSAKINTGDFSSAEGSATPFNIHSNLLTVKKALRLFTRHRPDELNISIENAKVVDVSGVFTVRYDSRDLFLNWTREEASYELQGTIDRQSPATKISAELSLKSKKYNYKIVTKGLFTEILHGETSINVKNLISGATSSDLDFRSFNTLLNVNVTDSMSELDLEKLKFVPKIGVQSVSGDLCQLQFVLEQNPTTELSCDSLRITNPEWDRVVSQSRVIDQAPSTLSIDIQARLNEADFFDPSESEFAEIEVSLDEVANPNFTLSSKVRVSFTDVDEKILWDIKTARANLEAQSFQRMVGLLEGSQYAIPAPLSALDGKLSLSLRDAATQTQGIRLDTKGVLRLQGEGGQKVNLDLESQFYLQRVQNRNQYKVDASVLIKDIHLYLPPLDPLIDIPKLSKDQRLTKEPDRSSSGKSQLEYSLKVRSERKNSIRLYHDLLKPHIEGDLKVNLGNDSFRYRFTQAKPFDIVYLKRRLKVQALAVGEWNPKIDKTKLDIKTIYQAAGYDISIDVFGNAESPKLSLSSKPSLPREDIISVLLYNRTSDSLSRTQNQNVGGTEAAIADRALGLIGIWAFASTPIESVSYNSRSQTYQAQIALPGQVRLSIGTDWEQSQYVGIRKRVSENWVLVTGYESGQEDDFGTLFLQREFYY